MTPRTKKTAAALSGALVLASGAYALGSQTGDGQALAGQNANATRQAGYGFGYGPGPGKHGFRGGPRQDLADAAKKLGVSQDKLLAALKSLRDDRKGKIDDFRAAFEKALAKQLGIPESEVESALDKRAADRQGGRKLKRDGRRGDMRDAFAKQLAAKLGITEAKVRSALDAQRKAGPPGPPDLSALATKLGVTEAKLRGRAAVACGRAPAPVRRPRQAGFDRLGPRTRSSAPRCQGSRRAARPSSRPRSRPFGTTSRPSATRRSTVSRPTSPRSSASRSRRWTP